MLTGLSSSSHSQNPAVSPAETRTPALVVSLRLGVSSEVWIGRQILGFKALAPEVLCWKRENAEAMPLEGVPVHVLPFPEQPAHGHGRWVLRLRNLRERNFYGAVGLEARALERVIRRTGARVILCHFGHVALRVLPAARACGVPVVAHFHGLDVSSGLRNRWYRASLLRHLNDFAAIVVVGSHQRDWMLRQGVPADRVHLIPCGVPTSFFNAHEPTKNETHLRVAAVSRLTPWKGVAESIHALALVRQRGVDAELSIIGEGAQREELESWAARLGIQRHVHFLGARPPDQVRQLLHDSDVFVQHSLTSESGWCEGFGVSLAEAAAMGLPVVATRSGGIPDQVVDGETGYLVEERDVTAMSDALARLARDPELRNRLGTAGRARMIERFDTNLQIGKLERVLLDAAACPTPALTSSP